MALRLTDASDSPEPSSSPAAGAPLAARAEACLAARDIAGYRALFAEAAAIEDIHRRYDTRKRLIEAGLTTGGNDVTAMGTV